MEEIDEEKMKEQLEEEMARYEEDGYFNAESPKGILYNMHNYYVYDQDTGGSRYYSVQPIDTGEKPIELDIYQAEILEGYYLPFLTLNEDGRLMLNYDGYGGISVSENGSQTAYDGGMVQKDAEENGIKTTLSAGAVITDYEYWMGVVETSMIYPMSVYDAMVLPDHSTAAEQNIVCSVLADQHGLANDNLKKLLEETRLGGSVYDLAENYEVQRLLVRVVNVFAYGFIILISLIAVANVFNTISTNISLRRREFAMLRSVGMSQHGFSRMMNYECLIYGLRGLLWGLPLSILVTYAIYRVTDVAYDISFYVPWYSIAIAVCSVFAVVFIAMWYAAGKIRGDNTVDALKNENI